MNGYGAVGVYVFIFHSPGLDSVEPSVSRSSCFYSQETFNVVVTWRGTQPGWKMYNKRRTSHPSCSLEQGRIKLFGAPRQ